MNKNNRNNEQIYGRNDMIMLDQNNKIYGSLGLADNYVMKTEEGTRLVLNNPKLGRFGDVLTEFNIYGMSKQESTTGANLIDVDSMLNECLVKNDDGTYRIKKTETNRFSKRFPVNLKAGTKIRFDADVIEYNGTYNTKLQIVMGNQTLSAGQTIILDSDVTEVKIYQDNKNDVGTYTKFKNAMLSIGEAQIPYEPYTGGKPSPSPEYPQEIVSVVNPTVKVTNEDGTQFETVTLPYTLNAIPAYSGGNITIDGQRYAADYVDADRGKFVQMINSLTLDGDKLKFVTDSTNIYWNLPQQSAVKPSGYFALSKYFSKRNFLANSAYNFIYTTKNEMAGLFETADELNAFVAQKYKENDPVILYYFMREPIENDLAPEEIEQYKKLSIRTPTTIIENNYNTWMKATYKSIESV